MFRGGLKRLTFLFQVLCASELRSESGSCLGPCRMRYCGILEQVTKFWPNIGVRVIAILR